ncbi:hypothetical protein BJP37_31125 [Moorena bouillonii PNG]|uniref:Uncharacterized protein n=1 Tax=Moorena bouillonii PNG TaxID=568701 RepID=A0A1U7NA63_9CYAN|nr:hypothetical protein BJP37_31125 [Moorena bouillonii PNG]
MVLELLHYSGFQFGEVQLLGNREQGTGNREQGAGSREQGAGSRGTFGNVTQVNTVRFIFVQVPTLAILLVVNF